MAKLFFQRARPMDFDATVMKNSSNGFILYIASNLQKLLSVKVLLCSHNFLKTTKILLISQLHICVRQDFNVPQPKLHITTD